jgi:large repetitive protein
MCSLDGAPFAHCMYGGLSYTGLIDGTHTFAVYAIDGDGNADPTPATYTWTVDTS